MDSHKSKTKTKIKMKTKMKTKTKKNVKNRIQYNPMIKKNIDFIMQYNPTYPKCYYDEYFDIKDGDKSFKKYYKSYVSNQQFKSLLEASSNADPNIFYNLLRLVSKRFSPFYLKEIINILFSLNNDDIIYSKLKKLYNSSNNKIKGIRSKFCNKNLILAQNIYNLICSKSGIEKAQSVKKYLDIGTGTGKFAITLGKLLNLPSNSIYGCDLSNFAEQKDWGRDKTNKQFIFNEIKYNKPYPYEDNFFDVISLKMVIHHIKNIDFTLNEIKRILKKDGLLILIDHDSFTYIDYMLCDIEHGLYMNVFNEDSFAEEYTKQGHKSHKPLNDLGFIKYRDWVEFDNLISKYGFQYERFHLFSEHIYYDVAPTRITAGYYSLKYK